MVAFLTHLHKRRTSRHSFLISSSGIDMAHLFVFRSVLAGVVHRPVQLSDLERTGSQRGPGSVTPFLQPPTFDNDWMKKDGTLTSVLKMIEYDVVHCLKGSLCTSKTGIHKIRSSSQRDGIKTIKTQDDKRQRHNIRRDKTRQDRMSFVYPEQKREQRHEKWCFFHCE